MLTSFLEVGQQVVVLFILIGLGALLTKLGFITEGGSRSMTDIVLYAVTPCVIINAFQREFKPELLGGLLIAFAIAAVAMGVSIAVAELMFRRQGVDRGVVLKAAVVFSNCGFMALPLQEAVLGTDGVFYGAAYIAVFNIFMWTYGLITMSRKTSLKATLKALANPGIIGTVLGVLLFVLSVELPVVVLSPIKLLAALNTPLPMLIIGYHLMNSDLKKVLRDKWAYAAMAMRLIVLPLAALGVMYLLRVDGTIMCSVIIAVSAPVAANTTMMSSKFGRDTDLSAGIVSASSLFSLATMPLVIGLAKFIM